MRWGVPVSAPADALSAEERARVEARWPSAQAFYSERDDRTRRSVGDVTSFAVWPVEILVDPLAATNVTVQRIVLVVTNLTARWARCIRVVLPDDVPLAPTLSRDGARTLNARVLREMTLADPFGDWTLASSGTSRSDGTDMGVLRLFVGPWSTSARTATGTGPEGDDYQVDARWWSAMGARGKEASTSTSVEVPPASVPAAGLAGALGAADLFKRAAGHPDADWMPTYVWDVWTHTLKRGLEAWASVVERPVRKTIDLGRTLLAGVGAIGSAFVYLADLAPLTGALTLFDRDRIEVTNLNRAPLFSVLHALDEPEKSHAVAAYLSDRMVTVTPMTGAWRDHAAAFGGRAVRHMGKSHE
jgi:hypothetical protein